MADIQAQQIYPDLDPKDPNVLTKLVTLAKQTQIKTIELEERVEELERVVLG